MNLNLASNRLCSFTRRVECIQSDAICKLFKDICCRVLHCTTGFVLLCLAVSLVTLFHESANAKSGGNKGGDVSVKGYVRKDGTVVQPHVRSAPDGNAGNNWSTYGNTNPYTGKDGTKVAPYTAGYSNSPPPLYPLQQPWTGLSSAPSSSETQIPKNAKINVYGNRWDCQRGYYQSGNQCLPVEPPQNAKLNYLGSGWDCQRGYYQSGNQCVATGASQ